MHYSSYISILLRALIAVSTRTVFQPDEYFQSLEPAHYIVFGYGSLTWEWLASKPIRSIVYPLINVPIYWLLKVSGLSDFGRLGDYLVITLPKILHGVLAAFTDIYVGEIARLVLGRDYVTTTHFLSLTSFFHALSLSRSLSNSLETSLSTISFSFYPWDASPKISPQLLFNRPRLRKMLFFAALACMIRPTNAVIWVYLLSNILWSTREKRHIVAIAKDVALFGSVALFVLFILDSIYYGKATFTPFNFLKTNLSAVSLFYGSNPWHFYLTQALPILCTTTLPFTLHGIWTTLSSKSPRNCSSRTMLVTILWSIGVYSFAGHKEWRFLHPILPLLHVFTAKSLVDLSFVSPSHPKRKRKQGTNRSLLHCLFDLPPIPPKYLVIILSTIPASLYVILFYCSGPVEVLSYFRNLPKTGIEDDTIGFLMPCHSTPGHAYLHRKSLAEGRLWQLGCEPPLNQQDLKMYKDQTDIFFESPQNYLRTYFPNKVNGSFPLSPFPASIPGTPPPLPRILSPSNKTIYPWKHEWPRYLVFFGDLLRQDGVKVLLEGKGYEEVGSFGREWEGEGKRKGGVRVWKWIRTGNIKGLEKQ